MTNALYLAIFLDHTSASALTGSGDYLVLEKYRFRRLSSSRSATTTRSLSFDIKLLL